MPTSARPTALLVMCHCETSDRCHWLWQSVPLAPLPKGGWHGEAVAVRFFSRTPCNPSVGAGFYPARGRGRAPPLRTSCSPSVGATLAVARPSLPGRAHGPCPTRCCVIGPGRTESSAPTSISVGAILAISRRTPKPPHYFSPPLVLPRRMCYNFLIKVEF